MITCHYAGWYPHPPFNFSARDVGDADIWRTYDSLTIRPGEERSVALAYEISQPTYDSWYRSSRTVALALPAAISA